MRIVIAFVNIVLGLLMILFSISALNNYFSENQNKYDHYLLLKTDGVETDFIADDVYTIDDQSDNDEESYNLSYTFKVGEDLYHGTYHIDDTVEFDKSSLKGTFLIDNPAYSAVDIDQKLDILEAKMEGGEDLKWGLISAALSLLLFFLGIRSVKLHKASKS